MGVSRPYSRLELARQTIETLMRQHGPGERLPSEDQLAELCGVSRPTVRTALIALEQEGLVIRRHGLGTFVVKPRSTMKAPLQSLYSVADIVRTNGYEPTITDVDVSEVSLSSEVAQALHQDPDCPGYRVVRTVLANGDPAVFLIDYLARQINGVPVDLSGFRTQMIPYLKRHGIIMAYAVADLSLGRATAETAHALNLLPGDPVLQLAQVAYTANNEPIIYSIGHHREGFVTYSVVRTMKDPQSAQFEGGPIR